MISNLPSKYQRLRDTGTLHYDDKNACSVIAVAVACDVSYGKAYAALQRAGRKHRKGATIEQIEAAMSELGYEVAPDVRVTPGVTVNQAMKILDKTPCLVVTKGHVYTMIDGVRYDHTTTRRKVVRVYSYINREELA